MEKEKLLDMAPCGYVSFDDRGIIVGINLTLAAWLGYAVNELVGQKLERIMNIAGRIFFQTHLFPLLKLHGKADEIFLSLSRKDGELIPVVTSGKRETDGGAPVSTCIFLPVYHRRKYEDEIIEARRAAEKALKENSDLISARAEAELHALELDRQLGRLNQMNSDLVEFSKIINHDMQECVRKIQLFTSIAMREPERHSALKKVQESAYRLQSIIASLELFIDLGNQEQAFREVDLNDCAARALESVKEETDFRHIRFECDELPHMQGIEPQLTLLFYHLFRNSVKFRRESEVRISITSAVFEDNYYKNLSGKYAYGVALRLRLTDNGAGVDSRFESVLFRPFTTLSQDNTVRLGFGLAICKKIVTNHFGKIALSSKQGLGTTVVIDLPLPGTDAAQLIRRA